MKLKTIVDEKPLFKPYDIVITIENQVEENALYSLSLISEAHLKSHLESSNSISRLLSRPNLYDLSGFRERLNQFLFAFLDKKQKEVK
jgi:hypothetical protein